MDAFLLDAPEPDHACASTEDLAAQLAQLRNAKVTDTKAEHISATFEFRSTVVFNVQENENEVAESQNPDQSAGGSPGAAPPAPMNGDAPAPATREIQAIDTLLNQPTDDPAVQKLVAKHIIASLGSVDGSSWTVRSVSRNSSGWTFTYLCKHSTQAWMRQNSKHSAKPRIAESSGKDGQDALNLSRPAFDCRGSVTIAFAKSRRAITVKLEHTPLHKTVAELAELFKPPPLLPRTEAAKRKNGDLKKRKTQPDGVEAPEGGPKKKSKKTANDAEQDGAQTSKPKKPRASKSKKIKNAAAQSQSESMQNSALLNLSPLETARRQEEASKKLQDNGIDPDTLSAEQFNIFANQSPDLQLESLAMLVKYGAERLRIVHPSKDNTPQSPHPSNSDNPNSSTRKKKSSRKKPSEDGTPKVKKTRGSCQACRAKKIKCTKDKPECQECVGAGIACYYPPQQSRKSVGTKSAEVAVDEPDLPEAARVPNPTSDSMPGPEPVPHTAPEEEASDLGSPGFDTHQPPHEIMPHQPDTSGFAGVGHDVAQDLYQPAPSGLSYPQGVGIPEGMSNADYFQPRAATNGAIYPQPPHEASDVAYAPPSASHHEAQDPEPEPLQPSPIPSQPNHQTLSRNGTRRSLPSGSGQHAAVYANPTDPGPAASWQSTNIPSNDVQAYSESPTTSQSAPTRQYRNKQSLAPTTYDTAAQDALQAATTLTQAALQKQPHASPTARIASPFANPAQAAQVARTKSRQSQRAQSRQTASPFQQSAASQPPPTAAASSLYNAPSTTASESVPGYEQYSRYSNTPTQATTTSSRVAYGQYSQQAGPNSSATSYSGYGTYDSRSKAASTTSLANPVSQSAAPSHAKAAAPSSKNWTGGNGRRNNSYSSNKAPAASTPTYNVPVSSIQQQSTNMQSFNSRHQSTAPTQARASGNTSASYVQQPQQQHPQQQSQKNYNSYSSQTHSTTSQQRQEQQQDWYGFGSTDNTTSNYGSGYGQHRSMNLTSNTYSSIDDQEALYEILRNNSRH